MASVDTMEPPMAPAYAATDYGGYSGDGGGRAYTSPAPAVVASPAGPGVGMEAPTAWDPATQPRPDEAISDVDKVGGGWWVVVGGWWLVVEGWWVVGGGWRVVGGDNPLIR